MTVRVMQSILSTVSDTEHTATVGVIQSILMTVRVMQSILMTVRVMQSILRL